jgi:hypothetical protein
MFLRVWVGEFDGERVGEEVSATVSFTGLDVGDGVGFIVGFFVLVSLGPLAAFESMSDSQPSFLESMLLSSGTASVCPESTPRTYDDSTALGNNRDVAAKKHALEYIVVKPSKANDVRRRR